MAETLIEKNKKQNYAYGITPEMRMEARKRLDEMIQEQGIKRFTEKDFQQKFDGKQAQEEIQAEVDEFLQMREEWRKEDRKLRKERE